MLKSHDTTPSHRKNAVIFHFGFSTSVLASEADCSVTNWELTLIGTSGHQLDAATGQMDYLNPRKLGMTIKNESLKIKFSIFEHQKLRKFIFFKNYIERKVLHIYIILLKFDDSWNFKWIVKKYIFVNFKQDIWKIAFFLSNWNFIQSGCNIEKKTKWSIKNGLIES